MAGKIVVSEILSDTSSSNTVKIGSGMTLDLNSQGTIVLPASIPAANLTGSLPAGMGGKVLQVVSLPMTSSTSATTSYAGVHSVSITPSSTSSKIMIVCFASVYATAYNTAMPTLQLRRGASGTVLCQQTFALYTGTQDVFSTMSLSYLDPPSTTSAQVYEMGIDRGSSSTANVSTYATSTDKRGGMTLMEIAG
jgi:hypothetical protein